MEEKEKHGNRTRRGRVWQAAFKALSVSWRRLGDSREPRKDLRINPSRSYSYSYSPSSSSLPSSLSRVQGKEGARTPAVPGEGVPVRQFDVSTSDDGGLVARMEGEPAWVRAAWHSLHEELGERLPAECRTLSVPRAALEAVAGTAGLSRPFLASLARRTGAVLVPDWHLACLYVRGDADAVAQVPHNHAPHDLAGHR